MADITQVDPTVSKAVSDAVSTEQLVVAIVKAMKAQGVAGAAAQIPAVISQVETDVADFTAAVPAVKAGMKTTEFWVGLACCGALTFIPTVTKAPVALPVASAIGALGAVYIGFRSVLKIISTNAAAAVAVAQAKAAPAPAK